MLALYPIPGCARFVGRENLVKRDDLVGVEIGRICTTVFSLLSSNFRYPLLGHVKQPSARTVLNMFLARKLSVLLHRLWVSWRRLRTAEQ